MVGRKFSLLLIPAILFLSVAPLLGQATVGRVVGTIVDATGGIIPGVELTLTNTGTGQTFVKLSSDSGAFTFPSLIS